MNNDPAFFHLPSGAVRFWVLVDGVSIGASIGKEVLHYRPCPAWTRCWAAGCPSSRST
jgi:hypothetical protein